MIDPALESYVRESRENPNPHPSSASVPERRAAYRARAEMLRGSPQTVASTSDHVLELIGRSLRARLYVPEGDEGEALVLYFHGGSFVLGDLETHDALCRRLASGTRMRFLAIDYRLAPEHPFPAAVEDAVDVTRLVASDRGTFAGPKTRLVLMGDSAGATLVAVAAALTRSDTRSVTAQVLIYPTLGPEVFTDSSHQYATGYLLEMDHLRFDYGQYLADVSDHTDPRASPLLFTDLAGAPPAIVLVAEFDPLRDEGLAYAGLLEHFGVKVETLEAKGMVHGFVRLGSIAPEAMKDVDDLATHLRQFVEGASS